MVILLFQWKKYCFILIPFYFQAEKLAEKINAGGCIQCSAKTQEGLKAVFDKAVNV